MQQCHRIMNLGNIDYFSLKKQIGNARNWTSGSWARSAIAIHCTMLPPNTEQFSSSNSPSAKHSKIKKSFFSKNATNEFLSSQMFPRFIIPVGRLVFWIFSRRNKFVGSLDWPKTTTRWFGKKHPNLASPKNSPEGSPSCKQIMALRHHCCFRDLTGVTSCSFLTIVFKLISLFRQLPVWEWIKRASVHMIHQF